MDGKDQDNDGKEDWGLDKASLDRRTWYNRKNCEYICKKIDDLRFEYRIFDELV